MSDNISNTWNDAEHGHDAERGVLLKDYDKVISNVETNFLMFFLSR